MNTKPWLLSTPDGLTPAQERDWESMRGEIERLTASESLCLAAHAVTTELADGLRGENMMLRARLSTVRATLSRRPSDSVAGCSPDYADWAERLIEEAKVECGEVTP